MTGDPVVVLLAGGLSRRMGGGDKSLRDLAGQPMLAHVIRRLQPQADTFVINANGDPERFALFNLPVTPDPIGGYAGPLVGVLAGLRWLESTGSPARSVVTVPTDAPFLPDDLIVRLAAAAENNPNRIVLAASAGRTHPVCGLWPRGLVDDLDRALRTGTRKVLDWTDGHDTVVVEFNSVSIGNRMIDPFFNANRPEELDEAATILGAAEVQL